MNFLVKIWGGMLAVLVLVFLLALACSAPAKPLAVGSVGGTAVVLTDEVDESICPVGTHLAAAKVGEKVVAGCWKLVKDDEVAILWLGLAVVPKAAFEAVKPDLES